MARLNRDMASEEVGRTIDESARLAKALGINGTPGYVVGDKVTVGALGQSVLKEKVDAARNF